MDAEEYQLIEKYRSEELSDAELQSFEDRMQHDAEFAAFVKTYIEINESLQASSDSAVSEKKLRNTIEKVSPDYFSQRAKSVKVVSMRNIYWAAAASILLIISFVFIYNQQDAPTYKAYSKHQPLVLAVRSDENNQLKKEAEIAFNDGRYENAALHLETLVKSDSNNYNLQLYWAISLIEVSEYSKGDSLLSVIEASKSIYSGTATWYQALSLLKQGKNNSCKNKLQEIPSGSSYHKKAQELLDAL